MKKLYFRNTITEKVVDMVIEEVEAKGCCEVSFDVTGRTRLQGLANELKSKLPQYDFEIEYWGYKCRVSKK